MPEAKVIKNTLCMVDAGAIAIVSEPFAMKYKPETFKVSFELAAGRHVLGMKVYHTYKGTREIHVAFELSEPTRFYLGDPCYLHFNDNWDAVLDATKYLTQSFVSGNEIFAPVDTGGDGEFRTIVRE